jgi:hypothetical protein
MSNGIPEDFEICWYMRGVGELASVFVVQLPDDAAEVRYSSVGCDEDGVFLMTDDGEKTRISDDAGVECYDDTEECTALRLLVLNSRGGHDDEYEIARLPREAALVIGA